jgi:hypothetical protein
MQESNTDTMYEKGNENEYIYLKERSDSVSGKPLELQAYLLETEAEKTGEPEFHERVLWTVGDITGADAKLEIKNSMVRLPQGRTVVLDGRRRRKFEIPQYLTDVLVQDLDELRDEVIPEG